MKKSTLKDGRIVVSDPTDEYKAEFTRLSIRPQDVRFADGIRKAYIVSADTFKDIESDTAAIVLNFSDRAACDEFNGKELTNIAGEWFTAMVGQLRAAARHSDVRASEGAENLRAKMEAGISRRELRRYIEERGR